MAGSINISLRPYSGYMFTMKISHICTNRVPCGCKERVLEYVNGVVEGIPELEQTLYPDAWLGRNPHTGRQGYNSFVLIASVNQF